MCGISGLIGQSKDPELSFLLSSKLFEKIETRGRDAAGFWASNKNNNIFYHKEPIESTKLVKKPFWTKIRKFNPNVLLCHARKASAGVGVPEINKNNHPFVSYDKKTALMHNGRIHELEYEYLTKYYQVNSNCDSEILLRIFENEEDELKAIEKIWTYSPEAYMAVAIAKTEANKQKLHLFRNDYRPLCIIDLREILGQIFFCSTTDMWESALSNKKLRNLLKKRVKVTILPSHQLWSFELTDEIQQKIYTIKNGSELQTLSHPKIPLKPSIKPSGVFCELDEDEDPPNHIKPLKHPYEPLDEEEVLYGPLCPKHSMLPNFWNQQKDKLLLGCEFQN